LSQRSDSARKFEASVSIDTYEMLYVSAPVFVETVELFEKYDDQELSVTDASTVALYERHDIDTVLSFDDDFDSIVDRVDPEIL